jgi:HSP20 family molecular chaperone IbpA
MWSEALQMLARAERLQREVFNAPGPSGRAAWEPPVDVLETEDAVLVPGRPAGRRSAAGPARYP